VTCISDLHSYRSSSSGWRHSAQFAQQLSLAHCIFRCGHDVGKIVPMPRRQSLPGVPAAKPFLPSANIDFYAGNEKRQLNVLDVGRLLYHVFSRQSSPQRLSTS